MQVRGFREYRRVTSGWWNGRWFAASDWDGVQSIFVEGESERNPVRQLLRCDNMFIQPVYIAQDHFYWIECLQSNWKTRGRDIMVSRSIQIWPRNADRWFQGPESVVCQLLGQCHRNWKLHEYLLHAAIMNACNMLTVTCGEIPFRSMWGSSSEPSAVYAIVVNAASGALRSGTECTAGKLVSTKLGVQLTFRIPRSISSAHFWKATHCTSKLAM